ncbi:hypothetical protein PFISCL1PPCAC_7727, partial [Pristionchus fissidentatus]
MDGPPLALYIVHTVLCLVSIVANLMLFVLIFMHTPPANRSYSILILSLCALELVTSTSSLLLFQRLIPCGTSLFMISSGPSILFHSRRLCFVLYSIMMHGHSHYIWMMAFLFCFRYFVLVKPTPRPRSVAILCVLYYIPTAIVFGVLAGSHLAPEKEMLEKLRTSLGYDMRGAIITGYMDIFEPRVISAIFWVCAPSAPLACLTIALSGRIHRKLSGRSIAMSDNTRRLHRELVQALTVQAALTIVFTLSVVSYLLGQLNIVHDPVVEYSTHMMGEICLATSPIVTIHYVRSYRR